MGSDGRVIDFKARVAYWLLLLCIATVCICSSDTAIQTVIVYLFPLINISIETRIIGRCQSAVSRNTDLLSAVFSQPCNTDLISAVVSQPCNTDLISAVVSQPCNTDFISAVVSQPCNTDLISAVVS